jgi:threonylcarbamoyladenosine tRNA methylthiotransferase MtaB
MKTIFIDSAGCSENIIDGAIIKNIAEADGYIHINNPAEADMIVFNTCAFKENKEDLCVKRLLYYEKIKKDSAKIVVCGCLVGINKEKLDQYFEGPSFSPSDLKKFYDIVNIKEPGKIEEAHHITREIADREMFGRRAFIERIYDIKKYVKRKTNINFLPNFNLYNYIGDENTLYIRISRGCMNSCGYCAIRFAQGKLVSRPMEEILNVVQKGIREGFDKVFLVGTNTSQYGMDIGTNFFDLLERIIQLEGNFKIIVHNFEPHGIEKDSEKFIRLFISPKILSFYFPINSGSQHVLNRMRRNYNIDNINELINSLKKLNRKVLIRSEFIVGYPGEKWTDFFQTVKLIRKSRFSQVDLHRYSPRPNIYALNLDQQVGGFTRDLRFIIVHLVVFFRVSIKMLRPI